MSRSQNRYIDPQIVICGDNCLNIVLQITQPLQRGNNFEIVRQVQRPGGNALVTAMALSKWGINSFYCGVMGEDSVADKLQTWMTYTGVNNAGVVTRDINTRVSYAIVDKDERTILDMRNSSKELSELQMQDWQENSPMRSATNSAPMIMVDKYCSSIHEKVKDVILQRRKCGENPYLIYRTGSRGSPNYQIESEILPWVDLAFTKGSFLTDFDLGDGPLESSKRFCERFNVPLVVATLGLQGALYFQAKSNKGEIISTYHLEKPETTLSAGDFFRAGYLLAHLKGKSIQEATSYGNLVAALHCKRPESEDIERMFFSQEELNIWMGPGHQV